MESILCRIQRFTYFFIASALLCLFVYYKYRRGILCLSIKDSLERSDPIPKAAHSRRDNEWLMERINQHIRSFVNKSSLLPPLVNYSQLFLISKEYNLASCQIEKVMSTFRRGMFCYLNRQHVFERQGRHISTEHWNNTLCEDMRNEKYTFRETMASLGKDPVMFSIIRHPVDRFLSGYVDKCLKEKSDHEEICFGCKRSISCFLKNLKKRLTIFFENSRKFTEAEKYYTRHFAPATWYCNLKESISYMAFIRYDHDNRERLADDIDEVLEQTQIRLSQRRYIKTELKKQLPVHSTAQYKDRTEVEKKLLSIPQLFTLIMEIFYYDFVVFDFDFPKPVQIL